MIEDLFLLLETDRTYEKIKDEINSKYGTKFSRSAIAGKVFHLKEGDKEMRNLYRLKRLAINWAVATSKCDFTDENCTFEDGDLWNVHGELHDFIISLIPTANIQPIYINTPKGKEEEKIRLLKKQS